MKNWIKFILRVNCKLDKMCENVDARIQKLSKNLTAPALKLCDTVWAWVDFKRRLVNLRSLYNSLIYGLDAHDWTTLNTTKFSDVDEQILEKCEKILLKQGYHQLKFKEDYQANMRLLESFKP